MLFENLDSSSLARCDWCSHRCSISSILLALEILFHDFADLSNTLLFSSGSLDIFDGVGGQDEDSVVNNNLGISPAGGQTFRGC